MDLPLYGYPDVLAAVTAFPGKDGVFTPVQGDSFFMFVQFDGQGLTLETSQASAIVEIPKVHIIPTKWNFLLTVKRKA